MELTEELEKDLTFSRFPPEKQEQIRQLVSYTTLLGLTGKDLVSIGGKLDRLVASNESKKNINAIKPWLAKVKIFDPKNRWTDLSYFQYTDEKNRVWDVKVTYQDVVFSLDKNDWFRFRYEHYNVGQSKNRFIYNILVNLYRGDIQLPDTL